ncbi:aspartate--tRNA ligase [Candidatus Uhrbacteria bacterium]|nr:aspartate--tRNA ligase [Candidatus Uhrbacteria bacterium]
MLRTHTCGELKKEDVGTYVTLCGWVQSRRDHGGLIFIDLRDRYGTTQVVFNPEKQKRSFDIADTARSEYVAQVEGTVLGRPDEMVNPNLTTGAIEVEGQAITVLNESQTPPFEIESDQEAERAINEERRLTYRYLDLRRPRVKRNIVVRHEMVRFIRNFLSDRKFLEVETPLLTKSTPEGARDYLVPARQHPGTFYSLPQSPQQYKQLLMVGGIDRYFQIAKCLRDEDSRGDRQAEFTQLDLEMSFVERDDVLDLVEEMMITLIEHLNERGYIKKRILQKPIPRLAYDDVMLRYGIDKPDLRFGLEISDITEMVNGCGFAVFADAVKKGGVVRALNARGAGDVLSRSHIDELTELAKKHRAKGLAYIKVKDGGELDSPIVKFLGDELSGAIVKKLGAHAGDIIFFGADHHLIAEEALAYVRLDLGRRLNMIDPEVIALSFTIDFPLFEPEMVDGHYAPMHHMFTMPRKEDISLLDTDPLKVKSWQYDLVINGNETAGGSIRIHVPDIQQKIFDLIGFSEEDEKNFAHMLEAFRYGAPPHGGMAPGIDRILMLLLDEPNIREVMAFPKTGDGSDLVIGAPAFVDPKQLKELGIQSLTPNP